jgi:hypothetical protein
MEAVRKLRSVKKDEGASRDQVIECHENEIKELRNQLDQSTKSLYQQCEVIQEELKSHNKDLMEKIEDLRKVVEQQGQRHDVSRRYTKKEFADEFENRRRAVKQQKAYRQELVSDAEDEDLLGVEVGNKSPGGMNKTAKVIAALRRSIQVETVDTLMTCLEEARQTMISYEHTLREESDPNINKCQSCEGFDEMRANVEARSKEVSVLRDLLKHAEVKLEERQEQILKLVQGCQELTKQVTNENSNSNSKLDIGDIMSESLSRAMSTWTETMINSKELDSIRRNDEESTTPNDKLPG